MADLGQLLHANGLELMHHQQEAVDQAAAQAEFGTPLRMCLYHRTGAGKTITSLLCAIVSGASEVLVLAPPITHPSWKDWGTRLGIEVTAISHAKFRQDGFKVRREQHMIIDEFHLLGGHNGKGWKKLDRGAKGLKGSLILCSATPSYNDAERVYCVQHVLDPYSCKGGFLQFLYDNCFTEANPFAKTPVVKGFLHYADAEHYLSQLPYVHYVEDEAIKQMSINDIPMQLDLPDDLVEYGLNRRRGRIIASQMEERHAVIRHRLVSEHHDIRKEVWDMLTDLVGAATTPVLMYCDSAYIAEILFQNLRFADVPARMISGDTPHSHRETSVNLMKNDQLDVLVGTAAMATGLDGIDKVCDTLIIVNDTSDDSLRRQLIGRILPRGTDDDLSRKQVHRLVFS